MDATSRNFERLQLQSSSRDASLDFSENLEAPSFDVGITSLSMLPNDSLFADEEDDEEEEFQPPESLYENIPDEYRRHLDHTEPQLYFLPKCKEHASLKTLLQAAQKDVRLHQARIQAALQNSTEPLKRLKVEDKTPHADKQQLEEDVARQQRQARQEERAALLHQLQQDSRDILAQLTSRPQEKEQLTYEERVQVKLARWQRALELYVYSPAHMIHQPHQQPSQTMDMLGLLEALLQDEGQEEELVQLLTQASRMCTSLQELTAQAVQDAAEDAAEAEDAYQIRLEAHAAFGRRGMVCSDDIQTQFRTHGRAALHIGQQLEYAESKRRQCEQASILIRRWWMMESLAEQEALSGEPLRVEEEVHGVIPMQSCRMDSLFTAPERSYEAARALKQLRAVVKSRGNTSGANATGGGGAGSGMGYMSPAGAGGSTTAMDPASSRRFELTAMLIARTSVALENRLLNSFKLIYSQGGGGYNDEDDFPASHAGRVVDWAVLRDLAQALLLFDNGRNLRETYLECVINSRFPELFRPHLEEESGQEEVNAEFDMERTRSKLSSLFHRVSEGCTAEFELIAHVFGTAPLEHGYPSTTNAPIVTSPASEEMPLTVARALLQRVITDPKSGLQARISELLESIDRRGDFDAGAKKLDTFVVIHEKAAGLFDLLKVAAKKMLVRDSQDDNDYDDGLDDDGPEISEASAHAVSSLQQFLTSQEIALSNSHRRGYLNLELRLLHHDCCSALAKIDGCELDAPPAIRVDPSFVEKGILEEYRAPILPLKKHLLMREGFIGILPGPLKPSVLRQPLIYATDSLARARLMFGFGKKGGEGTARVITSMYSQMCSFYGTAFLFPVVRALGEMLPKHCPSTPPSLPFDENSAEPDLGVDPAFWVGLERIHSAAKSFDRELWAQNRPGSARVWEILSTFASIDSVQTARDCRLHFFSDLERLGEAAILKALTTLNEYIRWILVTGGESMSAAGGSRIRHHITGQYNGPYSIPAGASLEAPNSPAVKSLTFCLRSQFVNVQAALTSEALSAFWTALSMRLYDVLVPRLLQHYYVSTVGAVILSRDVEALRSVSMLAGSDHTHWDNLRELVTLYMTPPDALKTMLVGPEGNVNSGKGLFHRVGRHQALVFMSRRIDYQYKTAQGPKKSGWAIELLKELGVPDLTDGQGITKEMLGMFAAHRFMQKK